MPLRDAEPIQRAVRAIHIGIDQAASVARLSHVHIATVVPHPLTGRLHGSQLHPQAITDLLGARRVRAIPMPWMHTWLLVNEDGDGPAWWIADCGPLHGPALLVAWEMIGDTAGDVGVDLLHAGGLVSLDEEEASEEADD